MSQFGGLAANINGRMDQTHKETVNTNPSELSQYKKAISTNESQNLQASKNLQENDKKQSKGRTDEEPKLP
jgi:hypothetical protein